MKIIVTILFSIVATTSCGVTLSGDKAPVAKEQREAILLENTRELLQELIPLIDSENVSISPPKTYSEQANRKLTGILFDLLLNSGFTVGIKEPLKQQGSIKVDGKVIPINRKEEFYRPVITEMILRLGENLFVFNLGVTLQGRTERASRLYEIKNDISTPVSAITRGVIDGR